MMEVLTSSHPPKTIESNYFDVPSAHYHRTVYQSTGSELSRHTARHPPTPPQDHSLNMSLPPIASLLRLSRDESRVNDFTAHQHPHYPPYRDASHLSGAGHRDDRSLNGNTSNVSQHLKLPPTPPMQSHAANSHTHSPPRGPRTQPPPLTTKGVLQYDPISDSHNYRQAVHTQHGTERPFTNQLSYSPHTATAPPSATLSSPMTGPNSATTPHSTSYHRSPLSASQRALYPQRSLPTDFPPPVHLSAPPAHLPPNVTSPTISQSTRHSASKRQSPQNERAQSPDLVGGRPNKQLSSSHALQSQDRYVCPTCGKAFSRPSSLRIHGHSHTGEKPFKCPHRHCGKAFSVRSNMKRHEKGCHAETDRRLDLGPGAPSRELLPAVAS